MKKVCLLGDSMRLIGYGLKVPALIADVATVWQPEDNCRFAKYSLYGVQSPWSSELNGSDVIHWNNGVWDTCDWGDGVFAPIDEYVTTMLRIAAVLQKQAKTVIFATTMPVAKGYPYSNNERIAEFNAAIVPELRARGILINDLYSLVAPHIDTFIRDDDHIHLTQVGIDVCAAQVAAEIRAALAAQ
ncbi:MAG: SGNH/GDSL hydrolase family protein [Clostridia bacterium]|nr:SGNH/GDSL hydrolase family protein [Clostridia bacterium]